MGVHQQQPTTKKTGGFPRSSLIQFYEATISPMFEYATAGHPLRAWQLPGTTARLIQDACEATMVA
jgi:hypothetical protein